LLDQSKKGKEIKDAYAKNNSNSTANKRAICRIVVEHVMQNWRQPSLEVKKILATRIVDAFETDTVVRKHKRHNFRLHILKKNISRLNM
jgi:hypothetical protein